MLWINNILTTTQITQVFRCNYIIQVQSNAYVMYRLAYPPKSLSCMYKSKGLYQGRGFGEGYDNKRKG